MYIFGGFNARLATHFNEMFEFDPQINRWTLVSALGDKPCKRRRQACVLVKNQLFLFGGTRYYSYCNIYLGILIGVNLIISPRHFGPRQPFHFVDNIHDQLVDHSDMYVLDFKPTLKTLCMIAVRKYKLDETSLPHNLK